MRPFCSKVHISEVFSTKNQPCALMNRFLPLFISHVLLIKIHSFAKRFNRPVLPQSGLIFLLPSAKRFHLSMKITTQNITAWNSHHEWYCGRSDLLAQSFLWSRFREERKRYGKFCCGVNRTKIIDANTGFLIFAGIGASTALMIFQRL